MRFAYRRRLFQRRLERIRRTVIAVRLQPDKLHLKIVDIDIDEGFELTRAPIAGPLR